MTTLSGAATPQAQAALGNAEGLVIESVMIVAAGIGVGWYYGGVLGAVVGWLGGKVVSNALLRAPMQQDLNAYQAGGGSL